MIRKMALVAALALAGCTGGDGGSSSSSASSTSSGGSSGAASTGSSGASSGSGSSGASSSSGGSTGSSSGGSSGSSGSSGACDIVGTWGSQVVSGPQAGTPATTVVRADTTFHVAAGQVTLDGNYTYANGQIDFLNTAGTGPTPGFSYCPNIHGVYTVAFSDCNTFTLTMVSDTCQPRIAEANGGVFHRQ